MTSDEQLNHISQMVAMGSQSPLDLWNLACLINALPEDAKDAAYAICEALPEDRYNQLQGCIQSIRTPLQEGTKERGVWEALQDRLQSKDWESDVVEAALEKLNDEVDETEIEALIQHAMSELEDVVSRRL